MLALQNKLKLDAEAIKSKNLTGEFSDEDLKHIGECCQRGWKVDEESRSAWLRRSEAGMNLALQLQENRSFPWADCANVKFPLISIAALQFHARAYPAIVDAPRVVKCSISGEDPEGVAAARAYRVACHMSWQRLEQDTAWESQHDRAILSSTIVGMAFKKPYYDGGKGYPVSDFVAAKDLTLNYWSKSVAASPRKTHHIPLSGNEVYTFVKRKMYRDCLAEPWYTSRQSPQVTMSEQKADRRTGDTPPATPDYTTPLIAMEQHVQLDLDGDGYDEPYIITFEKESGYVLRIVLRFDSEDDVEHNAAGEVVSIKAEEYFVPMPFIPSPDGGIYGIGFGVFLGPLNESVNSLINMLTDAGTLQTTAGGFLARGAKIRGGQTNFSPFEWKRVDSTGDDLQKSIFPLPVRDPSSVLFELLGLLINYTNRIAGVTDIMVGENPGQNTPAQTTQTMVEMGQKIYAALFKRLWRSAKDEFQRIFEINKITLSDTKPLPTGGTLEDYQATPTAMISPVADPNITSQSQSTQIATMVLQRADMKPGYDKDAVETNWLESIGVKDAARLYKGANDAPPPEDPKLVIARMNNETKERLKGMDLQADQQQSSADLQLEAIRLMTEKQLIEAQVIELYAKAGEAGANAQNERLYAEAAVMNARVASLEHESAVIDTRLGHLLKLVEVQSRERIEKAKLAKVDRSATPH